MGLDATGTCCSCKIERPLADLDIWDVCKYCLIARNREMSVSKVRGGTRNKRLSNDTVQGKQMKANLNKWAYPPARAAMPAQRHSFEGAHHK